MFGKQGKSAQRGEAETLVAARRHGRRPIRSSLTGPYLSNPDSRLARFELAARSALEVLRHELGEDLLDVHIGFATAPALDSESTQPIFYSLNRAERTIVLYRMPIQRAKVLHVDDAEHRAYFIGHCVHRAVCEYLGRDPWDVMPGHFDHY